MVSSTSSEKLPPCSCFSQNVRDVLLSTRLAVVGITVGAILIALGLLLHAYAGLGSFGMYFMVGAGAFVATSFILVQAIRYCLNRLSQPRSIGEAIYRRDLTSVEKFRSEFNSRDKYGKTPLYEALEHKPSEQGCDPVVRFLVDNGADVNMKRLDDSDWSPIHTAVYYHTPATIDFLLSKGADINATSSNGQTPMTIAIRENKDDVVKLLIERGADLTKKDNDGNTYLCWALNNIRDTKDAICLELINSGKIDLKAPNKFNVTALEWAVIRGKNVVIEKLLQKGANPNIKSRNGEWLLHTAIRTKRSESFKLLVTYGADLTLRDKDGKTALTLAQEVGLDEICIQLLLNKK